MTKLLYYHTILILIIPASLFSQGITEEPGSSILEIIEEDEENKEIAVEKYEELVELYYRKLNINLVSEEDLGKLPFLTEYQLFSFLQFREKYGRIYSPGELWLIPGFHDEIVRKISRIFNFGSYEIMPDTIRRNTRKIRQKILLRSKLEHPLRAGFSNPADSVNKFRGSSAYRLLKYEMEKKDRFRLGFTMESDAGEKITFDSISKGFNFNSLFFELYRKKIIRKIILGDFKIQSGEGLIFSSGRGGKSAQTAFKRIMPVLRKYSSTSEYGFYRGMAANILKGKTSSIIYVSGMRTGGNVYSEADSSEYFRSVNSSGLYRNQKELENRKNIKERSAGIIFSRAGNNLQLGLSFKLSEFHPVMAIQEKGDPYTEQLKLRRMNWQSAFYNLQLKRIQFSGEIALMDLSSTALQQKVTLFIHPLLTMNFSYRHFSPRYFCPGSSGFSESGKTRNESGFYAGLTAYPFPFLKLRVYMDIYRFPWIDSRSTFPLKGNDFLMLTEWYLHPKLDLRIYFKSEVKQFSYNPSDYPLKSLYDNRMTRLYYQLSFRINDNLSARSRFEMKLMQSLKKNPCGYLIYQELTRSLSSIPVKINIRYTLFDIPDWEVRVYSWEHDLLYSFSSPSYYKTGYNAFINFRWKAWERLNFGLKYSITGFTSLREAGTGGDYRKSGRFQELKVQCIIKL